MPVGLCFLLFLGPVVSDVEGGQRGRGRSQSSEGRYTHFKSRHYTVYTNLSRALAGEYARHMDTVFSEYSHRFRSFRTQDHRELPLYLFKTRDDYMGFLSRHGVDGSSSGGMFFVNPRIEGLATWTDGRSRRQVYTILQHEGFHQFAFSRMGRELPVWVNEGLAEYFEKGILVRGKMTLGLVPVENLTYLRESMREGRDFGFDQLFGISGEEWSENMKGERGRLQYEQSWSIVHFLVHAEDGRFQRAFIKYLTLVSKGRRSEKAFRTAFGARDTRAFEERWEGFVRGLEPDALGTTLDRMSFLGQGLEYLHTQGEPRPSNLRELRERLQRVKFRIYVWHAGQPVQRSSLQEELYRFPHRTGGDGAFELLEPSADNLPQRVGAPGSKPEPILTWRFDTDGELVSDFDFR